MTALAPFCESNFDSFYCTVRKKTEFIPRIGALHIPLKKAEKKTQRFYKIKASQKDYSDIIWE